MSKADERAYFDESYDSNARSPVWKYYAITRSSEQYYKQLLAKSCHGLKVLEYGCGPGAMTFDLAANGARVVGIDISSVAIDQARQEALNRGLEVEYHVMDAEALEFPDETFDLVCGRGIIHHLDVDLSMAEVARVLRSNGRAVFSEPLGHNPLLWIFRRLTPAFRTSDEHPLLHRDLRLMRKRFGKVEIKYFHLISLAAIPFLWTGFFHPVYRFLEKLDQLLFKILPLTGLLAWYAVIDLQDPGAAQSSNQKQALAKA